MICPACKAQMIVVEYKQIELDYCPTCNGVWFDADELELLLGAIDLPVEDLVRPPEETPSEKPRKCPYCRRKMEKVLTGPGGGVLIDRCRRGHGLWFDGGELDTVIAALRKPADQGGAADKAGGEMGSFLADVLFAGEDEADKDPQGEKT